MTAETILRQCTRCANETTHEQLFESTQVLASQTLDGGEDHGAIVVEDCYAYAAFRCHGCKSVVLERCFFNSDLYPDEYDHDCRTFPPVQTRKLPGWVNQLTGNESALFKETYEALFAGLNRLAAMGTRSLIDAYITRRVGDQGNFEKGLAKLVTEGLITEESKTIVEAAIDAGSASAHRGHCPSSQDLNVVIDIVENLIQNESLKEPAQTLKANTPPRQRISKGEKKSNP